MSDVRRVDLARYLSSPVEVIGDNPSGVYALMPWDDLERLQAVVEIAWNLSRYFEGREGTLTDEAILHLGMLRSKLHTLDGEP